MLEGDLLKQDQRERLEAAVKRTRWSWTNTAEFFGIRMDQMSGVRHGKRPWPVRFTEYLEAVADAIEAVHQPAPQGQTEVEVGTQPVATYSNSALALTLDDIGRAAGTPAPRTLSVADVAAALADVFMSADATEDGTVQAAVEKAVARLGIEAEVVEAIRERQQGAGEMEKMLQEQRAEPAYRSPPARRQPGALQQAAASQLSEPF